MKDEIVKKTSGMQAASVEELSAEYGHLGVLLRRQLDKEVIFSDRGPWVSLAFKYQRLAGNLWETPRVMLAFFKKMNGLFTRYSYFNVRTKQEAVKIIKFLMASFEIDREELE